MCKNTPYLEQLSTFIARLNNGLFTVKPSRHDFTGTIGSHTRHVIEFYVQFIAGVESGSINYDHRQRNISFETDAQAALSELQNIIRYFSEHKPDSEAVCHVVSENVSYHSSIGRELMYLAEHTVHHLALIRLIAESEGMDCNDEEMFGVASSTKIYRQSQNN